MAGVTLAAGSLAYVRYLLFVASGARWQIELGAGDHCVTGYHCRTQAESVIVSVAIVVIVAVVLGLAVLGAVGRLRYARGVGTLRRWVVAAAVMAPVLAFAEFVSTLDYGARIGALS